VVEEVVELVLVDKLLLDVEEIVELVVFDKLLLDVELRNC